MNKREHPVYIVFLFILAARPNFAGVTYNAGTSSISDITGASVPVATVTFTDTDTTVEDALTITMVNHNYFTFVDILDGTGTVSIHYQQYVLQTIKAFTVYS